jgi:hypothetical protein
MNKAHDEQHKHPQTRRPFHRDWRVWVGVVLILVALASYVLTNQEVLWPAAPVPQPAPAAVGK